MILHATTKVLVEAAPALAKPTGQEKNAHYVSKARNSLVVSFFILLDMCSFGGRVVLRFTLFCWKHFLMESTKSIKINSVLTVSPCTQQANTLTPWVVKVLISTTLIYKQEVASK